MQECDPAEIQQQDVVHRHYCAPTAESLLLPPTGPLLTERQACCCPCRRLAQLTLCVSCCSASSSMQVSPARLSMQMGDPPARVPRLRLSGLSLPGRSALHPAVCRHILWQRRVCLQPGEASCVPRLHAWCLGAPAQHAAPWCADWVRCRPSWGRPILPAGPSPHPAGPRGARCCWCAARACTEGDGDGSGRRCRRGRPARRACPGRDARECQAGRGPCRAQPLGPLHRHRRLCTPCCPA